MFPHVYTVKPPLHQIRAFQSLGNRHSVLGMLVGCIARWEPSEDINEAWTCLVSFGSRLSGLRVSTIRFSAFLSIWRLVEAAAEAAFEARPQSAVSPHSRNKSSKRTRAAKTRSVTRPELHGAAVQHHNQDFQKLQRRMIFVERNETTSTWLCSFPWASVASSSGTRAWPWVWRCGCKSFGTIPLNTFGFNLVPLLIYQQFAGKHDDGNPTASAKRPNPGQAIRS